MHATTDSDAHSKDRSKRVLRKQLRAARRALSLTTQQQNADRLARHLLASGLPLRAQNIAAYLPSDGEIDPLPSLQRLASMGKVIQLPRVIDDWRGQQMVFQAYRFGDALAVNRFNLPQPTGPYSSHRAPPTVVLAPLVGFDQAGNRLGMGGGFYDRYLARHPRLWFIGLAHSTQQVPQPLPKEPWDRPLDAVVTERGWQYFTAKAHSLRLERSLRA